MTKEIGIITGSQKKAEQLKRSVQLLKGELTDGLDLKVRIIKPVLIPGERDWQQAWEKALAPGLEEQGLAFLPQAIAYSKIYGTELAGGIEGNFPFLLAATDTVVYFDGQLWGKPEDESQAKEMIFQAFSNGEREYVTGFCWLNNNGFQEWIFGTTISRVFLSSDWEVADFLKKYKPAILASSGGFPIREAIMFDLINGKYLLGETRIWGFGSRQENCQQFEPLLLLREEIPLTDIEGAEAHVLGFSPLLIESILNLI